MGLCRKFAFLSVFVLALLVGHAHPTFAADKTEASPALKIAVLDDQKIFTTSLAAKSIDTQLKTRRDSIKKELAGLERKLADTKEKLDSQKDKVKQSEVDAFRKQYADARKLVDMRQLELEKAAGDGLRQMRDAVGKILTNMAEKDGYTLILSRQNNVLLAAQGLDITDKVLDQLNKALPSVKVKFDTSEKAKK